MASIKQRQSEGGVTGDPSPNIEFVEQIGKSLNDKFDHTHGTITKNDCYMFFTACKLGESYQKTSTGIEVHFGHKGCQNDLTALFISVFGQNEYVFLAALQAVDFVLDQKKF